MKIKREHYEHMKSEMAKFASQIAAHREHLKKLQQEGKVKDVEMRLRWDMMYAAHLSKWCCDNLYSYVNDTHIDTALRAIVKEFETEVGV